MKYFLTLISIAGVVSAILTSPDTALAQARSRVRLSSPGSMRSIGQGSTSTFRGYSSGLGSLRSSGGSGGSVLQSRIGKSGFSIQNSARAPRGNALDSKMSSSTGNFKISGVGSGRNTGSLISDVKGVRSKRLYNPGSAGKLSVGVLGASGGKQGSLSDAPLGSAHAYLDMIGAEDSQELKKKHTEAITSLAPKTESLLRTHIASGEMAFRTGEYRNALDEFQLAKYLAPRQPEPLLSMTHAYFAVSRFSYDSAGLYLREALKYFPELPLVNIKPSGFYDERSDYVSHLIRLQEYLNDFPYDADANLLLAYLRWFDGRTAQAHEALAKAFGSAKRNDNKDMLESVDIFWRGMLASGKVDGELKPDFSPERENGTPGVEQNGETENKTAANAENG